MQCSQEGTRNPFRITEIELRGHNPNDSQGGRENHSNIRSRITEDDIQHRIYLWSDIQRYQSIRARIFDLSPEVEHQSDELLQFFHDDSHETSHENNEL